MGKIISNQHKNIILLTYGIFIPRKNCSYIRAYPFISQNFTTLG